MPTIQHGGASIYFEESGRGFPILTFAPAGLQVSGAWPSPLAASPGSGRIRANESASIVANS